MGQIFSNTIQKSRFLRAFSTTAGMVSGVFWSVFAGNVWGGEYLSVEVLSESRTLRPRELEEFQRFILEEAWARIPADVREKIRRKEPRVDLRVEWTADSGVAADGLFIPTQERTSESLGSLRIRIREDLASGPNAKSLLAHEFFHVVHFLLNPDEEEWIREGLAQYFEAWVVGHPNGINVAAAFRNPTTPLQADYDVNRIIPEQYGHSYLYFQYLADHCGGKRGGPELIWRIAKGEGIEKALEATRRESALSSALGPECASFHASVLSFEIARIHNKYLYRPAKGIFARTNTFLLIPTTLPGPEPLAEFSDADASLLEPISPVVLSSSARLSAKALRGVSQVWLEREFPFRVDASSEVSPGSGWIRVLMKGSSR